MPGKNQKLQGTWLRGTTSPGNDDYPDHIEFKENGLYFGKKKEPNTFTWWDVGTYEVVSDNVVKISTANDAMITYQFTISGDTLRFVEPQGRTLEYCRAAT